MTPRDPEDWSPWRDLGIPSLIIVMVLLAAWLGSPDLLSP